MKKIKSIYEVTANEAILDTVYWLDQQIGLWMVDDMHVNEIEIPAEFAGHVTPDSKLIMIHNELPVSAEVKLDDGMIIEFWKLYYNGEMVWVD